MKAMIFAAGLGTRLKPITDSLPKALVPICGKPLLYHCITRLKAAGYNDITINIHHFPELIREYLAGQDWGVRISISDESEALLETGGGLAHARKFLEGAGPFLVHNVDIVSNLDLAWLRRETRPYALATLLVSERATRRYLLFSDNMRLVGWTDISTGEVRSPYPNLDVAGCRKYAFAGIHNISPDIFKVFDKLQVPARFPIMDFYLRVCADYPVYGVPAEHLKIVDVGKIDTLEQAHQTCREILLED